MTRPALTVRWGLAGVAMAAVLYPPAVAALTAVAAAGAVISLWGIPSSRPASQALSVE